MLTVSVRVRCRETWLENASEKMQKDAKRCKKVSLAGQYEAHLLSEPEEQIPTTNAPSPSCFLWLALIILI